MIIDQGTLPDPYKCIRLIDLMRNANQIQYLAVRMVRIGTVNSSWWRHDI